MKTTLRQRFIGLGLLGCLVFLAQLLAVVPLGHWAQFEVDAGRRKLQSCGSATFEATTSYCGSYNSRHCYDDVPCGGTCESDGECGTNGYLNNCGSAEVYVRVCSSGSTSTFAWSVAVTITKVAWRSTTTENGARSAMIPGGSAMRTSSVSRVRDGRLGRLW